MFQFEEKVNPATGVTEKSAPFVAELASVSKEAKEMDNEKKTLFRNAQCRFENNKGDVVKRQCIIYESNYKYGMEIGEEYAGRATQIIDENGKARVLLTLSHLDSAKGASLDDFGLEQPAVQTAGEADANLENVE